MSQHELIVTTNGRGAVDITAQVNELIKSTKSQLCHVFVAHTSASLMITGNEDANLLLDIKDYFQKYIPDASPDYRHFGEGDFDMSGHIRSIFTGEQKTIPIVQGSLALGKLQGLYLYEHHANNNARKLIISLI
ncbi:secondary thiamine-phosphate synthase enzyme YjbQ [Candidatus Thioglobus sp.]|nr:secondary thiamine-phosphate synthase enzyme YjbQ [Candidatus Thioglobus sp.]